jgi:prepilin-type processing-associated H-X9-DG protein
LIVVAIFGLLVSVLLPALESAKNTARTAVCGNNLRSIGQGLGWYLGENRKFPPSYVYPYDLEGNWDIESQAGNSGRPVYGYVHWSWMLYQTRKVTAGVFECPAMMRGGSPRTNPGADPDHWEAGQVDEEGNLFGSSLRVEDKQAARMAYTANAAIMPRNKFTPSLAYGGPRANRLVAEAEIADLGKTILITEFNANWKSVAVKNGVGFVSKSHRPINPFYSASKGAGNEIYTLSKEVSDFQYGDGTSDFGLKCQEEIWDTPELITGNHGPETNAVGRHHLLGDDLGGEANFLYGDGHVKSRTILETMKYHEWGDRFYSLTGNNEVK